MKTKIEIMLLAFCSMGAINAQAQCNEANARVEIAKDFADPSLVKYIGTMRNGPNASNGQSQFGNGYFSDGAADAAVYYSCKTGKTGAMWGDIWRNYHANGAEHGRMGWPLMDESPTPRKAGWFCSFQGGSIHYSKATGAHATWGLIRDKWAKIGWENGELGFPKSDEKGLPGGKGVYQEFEFGNIYYKGGDNQAYFVKGDIWRKWGELKWEQGILGFPHGDHAGTGPKNGAFMEFEHGVIFWSATTGSHYILFGSPIWNAWNGQGRENGALGFPSGDPYKDNDGTLCQKFQGGKIVGDHIVKY